MKILSLATACLMVFASVFAQEEEEVTPAPEHKPLQNHLQAPPNPAVYPLTLIDGDQLKNVSIMDREVKSLKCTLKNISDTPTFITRIATTCSCISLKDYVNITLKPGETLQVEMTLRGRLIKKAANGLFIKQIVVFTDKYDATYASVEGYVKNMLSFKPAQAIDLGDFIGDVTTWKRIITIDTLFEQDDLSLKPPKNNIFFNIATEKKGKNSFDVIITPKNPFPIDTIKETILLEVEGLSNYDPIPIRIKGNPLGVNFVLDSHACTIHKSQLNLDEPFTFQTQMTLSSLSPKMNRRFISRRQFQGARSSSLLLPVSKDEDEERPLDNPDSWKRFIPNLSAKRLPKDVKVEFTPGEMGVIVTFTLEPTFLKRDNPTFTALFQYKEQRIGFFEVIVQ